MPANLRSGSRWQQAFPILGWLSSYRRGWFGRDLIAGVIVVCLLVPEGMAFAQIAGMPPETVFSIAPPALLLFAIFASSRKLVVVVSATQAALSDILRRVGVAELVGEGLIVDRVEAAVRALRSTA
jgi:MFS superfamily sulfate permease-like transporter